MFKKILSLFICAVILLTLPVSCGKEKEYPIIINGVEIKSAPSKVVSLSPSFTDIIYLMKYDPLLVGISDRCDYEAAAELTRCGTPDNPNVDAILSLNADMVLTNVEIPYDAEQRLISGGAVVVTLPDADTRSSLKQLYSNIGSCLGGAVSGAAHGQDVAETLLIALDDIERSTFYVTEPKNVVYMDDLHGNKIATGDTFVDYIFSLCNTNNIASDYTDWQFDYDYISVADPQVIFCKDGIGHDLRRNTEFSNITAIKNRDVYEINELWIEKQGATLIDLAKYIVECTYPDLEEITQQGYSEDEPQSASEAEGDTESKTEDEA